MGRGLAGTRLPYDPQRDLKGLLALDASNLRRLSCPHALNKGLELGPQGIALAHLPLTQDPRLSRTLGTRHRAAIGITEESDCEVLVVSEETGTVSYAKGGHLKRHLTRETLRATLTATMAAREAEAA